jgi:hypothetical protein
MKYALDWYAEKGIGLGKKISVQDVIDLQNDARKDGLMTAQGIASDVIRREAPKYVLPNQKTPAEMTLSGLAFFVTDAITAEADKVNYLPRND